LQFPLDDVIIVNRRRVIFGGSWMDVNLLLLKKDGTFKAIPMPSSVTVMGRRKDCDLRIPLDAVSRRHCRLFTEKDTLKIRDLNSRNGTIVNGQTVEETLVNPGDKLTVGPLTFVMQVDGKPDKLDAVDTEPQKTADTDLDLTDDELFAEFSDIEPEDGQS
jgi:pSer/pThr/pTyr-binding forkhead associated (FHA) protein